MMSDQQRDGITPFPTVSPDQIGNWYDGPETFVIAQAKDVQLGAQTYALTQPQAQQAAAVPASPAKGSIELARSLCVDIAGPPDAAGDDTSGYGYGSVDVAEILSAEVVRLKALLSSAPAAPQAQGWLPIESAPRDGRVVLVGRHMGDFGFIRGYARFEGGDSFVSGWVSNGFDEVMGNLGLGHPTHWQPLPAPPVGITVGEGG